METGKIQEDFDWEAGYDTDVVTPMYTWCMNCEQVSPTRKWRIRKKKSGGYYFLKHGLCPCCGEWEEVEGLPWQQVRLEQKEYPVIPTIGITYPLHGWSEHVN